MIEVVIPVVDAVNDGLNVRVFTKLARGCGCISCLRHFHDILANLHDIITEELIIPCSVLIIVIEFVCKCLGGFVDLFALFVRTWLHTVFHV